MEGAVKNSGWWWDGAGVLKSVDVTSGCSATDERSLHSLDFKKKKKKK